MTPAQARTLAVVEGELARLIRYDDESLVHEAWIRQRYDGGLAASYAPARAEAARTAWHEAGHAVAALAGRARVRSLPPPAGGTHRRRVPPVHDRAGGGRLPTKVGACRGRSWGFPPGKGGGGGRRSGGRAAWS